MRSRYTARLNEGGFLVREEQIQPPVEQLPEGAELPEEEEPDEMPLPQAESKQVVTLDIIVQHDNSEALPGITLDLSMVDTEQKPRKSWKVWVDTAGLPKATLKQVSHVLEEPGYEENFGFYVEVRHPIPQNERSEYREFALAAAESGG